MFSNPGWDNQHESPNLARLDSLGNFLWHANYGDNESQQVKGSLTIMPSGIPLVCSEAQRFFSIGIDILGLDQAGVGSCANRTLPIAVEDILVTVEDLVLDTDTLLAEMVAFGLPVREAHTRTTDLCCMGMPDMDIWTASLDFPCPGHLRLTVEVCNNGYTTGGTVSLDVGFYDADPYRGPAQLLGTHLLTGLPNVLPGCKTYTFDAPVPSTGALYMLLNPPPGQSPPFDPYCGFAGAVPECGYYNNLDSVQVNSLYGTVLDLGPDKSICPGTNTTLAPGPGFASFLWQDGSTGTTLTVQDTGAYWVQAIDLCGIEHSDTVWVGFEEVQQFNFGFDTLFICKSETYLLTIPLIYDDYEWYFYYDGFGWLRDCTQGCTNTYDYYAHPSFPMMVGVGITSTGCKWADSLDIVVYPTPPPSQADTTACPTDSLLLGTTYLRPGDTDTVTLQTVHGCDSLVIYTVLPLGTFYLETDTAACEGEALVIAGQPVVAGSQLTITYPSQQGCDSTVLYRVAALPHAASTEEVSICPGATALIFGNEESGPGLYTGNFTAANGCDSTHKVRLSVFEIPEVEITATPTCEGKAEGDANVSLTGGDGPFLLQWGNGETGTDAIENLPAGQHSLTVSDVHGCSQAYVFMVENYPPSVVPVECGARLYAPTAFSPNGDGNNDRFTLYGNRRVLEIMQLQVYDVWGERVFDRKGLVPGEEGQGWDGTFRGQPLTPGVFVWRAVVRHEDGTVETVRGDVALVR